MKNNSIIKEGISFKSLLIAFGLLYASAKGIKRYKEYKSYKEISHVYEIINKSSSDPNQYELKIFNNILSECISDISNSKYSEDIKKYVIDSLNLTILKVLPQKELNFVSNNNSNSNSNGIFIRLENAEFNIINGLTKNEKLDNFIIIEKESFKKLKYNNLKSLIIHELYHYIDVLIKKSDGISRYSDNILIDSLLDKKIPSDEKYTKNKITFLYSSGKTIYDSIPSKFKGTIDDELFDYISNINYYTSKSELFARYNALKKNLLDSKIIKSISDPITIDEIAKYVINIDSDDIPILLFLDFSKIKEIDKIFTNIENK